MTQDGRAEIPPLWYSAKPIRGLVVDAATGQPLEGVVIVAQWVLHTPAGSGPRLEVLETVTDASGAYQFPGWGPKPNPRPFSSMTMFKAPGVAFFKPGYRPFFASNQYSSNEAVRESDWDGQTVRLERAPTMDAQLVRAIDILQGDLDWDGQQMLTWQQVPRMTLAILEERKRVPRALQDRISGAETLGVTEEEVRKFVEGLR